jgi:UDP-N-acetylglucosamine/UDP-N-acetylgalactosamine diphosphorylase
MQDQLQRRLHEAGQDHVLAWWPKLSEDQRQAFAQELNALDLDQLRQLYTRRHEVSAVPAEDRIAPIPVAKLDPKDTATRGQGEEALRRGEVAILVVAGGQGTRLGFDHAKGLFPIGPVTSKPLFQVHVEKVLALKRRYGRPLPLLVMTSPATHDETVAFFQRHAFFGLPHQEVTFFRQGTMPALDLETGKLLLEAPGSLCLSPNGHGGTLLALADAGLFDVLRHQGVRHVFYYQVDNPLVQVADPLFLGHHIRNRAEVSTKAIIKNGPLDKLGNLVLIDGRCSMIEYSDLPEALARQTDSAGQLRFRVGNPAIHIFDLDFLERVTTGDLRIPFHVAKKKVPHLDERGLTVHPTSENALKFEMFIFDVLPKAQRWTVVETDRQLEFHPLKNATGPDSPADVKQAMSNVFGSWLEQAGATLPREANRDVAIMLEISPLFALEAEDLRGKITAGTRIAQATYFD